MNKTDKQETRIDGLWRIEYSHTVGDSAAAFFDGLKRERVLASRCEGCGQVSVPPKGFCEECFVPLTELVEVGTSGAIEMATVVVAPFEGGPPTPYVVAYVLLDGATTAVANYVRAISIPDEVSELPEGSRIGDQVELRFADERQGRMTDFWFEPAVNADS